MTQIAFEWDIAKSLINQKKHGISFEEAKSAFYDERGLLISDPDHSDEEDRFLILGLSSKLRLLVVCHCYRGEDDVIRIISARRAEAHEAKNYKAR
jgi:uncharacterized DUF497 family protein